jgi:hypothetical protein
VQGAETGRRAFWQYAAGALVVALAVRLVYLFAAYVLGGSRIQRFHVETAALTFVLAGLALRLMASPSAVRPAAGARRLPGWAWFVFTALSLVLYRSALGVGFLADDFVLLDRAGRWELGPITPSLFRPLPLFGWALLAAVNAGAPVFHLLNVGLHGTNAYLTARVAERWVREPAWSVAAGCLMLTAPLATEAVAWGSGVFDLSATALTLTCLLLARSDDREPSPAQRAAFIAVGLLALAAKETAAVVGALVLVDALARRALTRRLLLDTAVLLALAAVFSAVRLLQAFGATAPEITRYRIQRGVFESYGSLAVPWHSDVMQPLPWMAIGVVTIVIALAARFVLMRSREIDRQVLAAAAWILVSVLPVFLFLYVGQDLQGARFLYLATPGWACLICLLASAMRAPFGRWLSLLAVTALAVGGVIGVTYHLQPWQEAGALRARIEQALRTNEDVKRCPSVALGGLPDAVRGAYVFRNGAREALNRLTGQTLVETADQRCTFDWRADRQRFVSTTR